jgi:superfamily I DNA/RNA helicase
LLDLVLLNRGLNEEREHQQRSRWGRFVNAKRTAFQRGEFDLSQRADLDAVVREAIETIGRPAAVALSPEYSQGQRFDQIVEETLARLAQQSAGVADVVGVLEAFGGDNAVRVMTVHKSKGLEFDTVIVFGVENQTFWAEPADERSVFFVGISRAKRRLILTVSDYRAAPAGARRWDRARSEHQEFIGYCPA